MTDPNPSSTAATSSPSASPAAFSSSASLLGGTGQGVPSATEDRALTLLGTGISAESVASALGVSPARISQLLSNKEFSAQVANLRYEGLQAHNTRDAKYDSLEDKLLDKLEKNIGLLFKPGEILKAIQVVNSAKRRGQSAPEQVTTSQNIVNLVLPAQIMQKFTTNVHNQVVSAGDQNLVTMQANRLLDIAEAEIAKGAKPEQPEQPATPAPAELAHAISTRLSTALPTEETANVQASTSPSAGANTNA